MIEINLIPDVKLELLRARRVRANVIAGSILMTIISGGVIAILGFYTFVVQAVAENLTDGAIRSESQKLLAIEDLSKTLTIQNQLNVVSSQHENKNVTSRVLSVAQTVVPAGKNRVSFTNIELNAEDRMITMEGEARNGYLALEALKKTIEKTKFTFSRNNEPQTPENIALRVEEGERRYGENSDGDRVLRFTLMFEYPTNLMLASSKNTTIVGPNRQTATDSLVGLPKSLFTDGSDESEEL